MSDFETTYARHKELAPGDNEIYDEVVTLAPAFIVSIGSPVEHLS